MVTIDKTDADNPVVKIEYRSKRVEMPVNKNLMRIERRRIRAGGCGRLYIPETDKAYIPLQAVHAVTGQKEKLPSVSK